MESNFRRYLDHEFKRRKKKNPRYSIRGFARDLGMDATALSRILAGKRGIGTKTAQKILKKLKTSRASKDALLRSLVAPEDHGIPLDTDYVEVTEQQTEKMNEWIYPAVLELTRSTNKQWTVPALAKYFGLPIPKLEKVTKTLLQLGLLKRTESGFRIVHIRATAPFRKKSTALRKIKSGYLRKAIDALNTGDEDSLSISGITVLADKEKIAEAFRRITEFRRSLAHFLSTDRGSNLYRLNIELFPLKSTG